MQVGESTINKSLASNMVAALVVVAGFVSPYPFRSYFLDTGLFALSGGITNWLAVHMLFERVPGLYGSGVVQLQFEEFKLGIRTLIMDQFFRNADLEGFFHAAEGNSEQLRTQFEEIIDDLDLDHAFESLIEVIMASSFGSMIGMVGGKEALNPLKTPFSQKMREYFTSYLLTSDFLEKVRSHISGGFNDDTIRDKVAGIIDKRLDQLTPQMVKEIVQAMIQRHLGWLVVWGCAIGGVIGFLVTVMTIN